MSDHDDFKHSLLNVAWRIYKTVEVHGAHGPVELEIRMPPPNIVSALMAKAKAIKDSGADVTPQTREVEAEAIGHAFDFTAEVISTTIWRPGAIRPLFTPEEVKSWPYAGAVQADCMAALNVAVGVEKAKGN